MGSDINSFGNGSQYMSVLREYHLNLFRFWAGPAAAMLLDQLAQANGQDKCGRSHFDDLNLTPCDEQVQRATADASIPASIGNPHADWLD